MEVLKKNYKKTVALFLSLSLFFILGSQIYEEPGKTYSEKHLHKIIVIGDSRMEYIVNGQDYNKTLPLNMEFIAKSGMAYSWFNGKAVPETFKFLNDKSVTYDVVINMGVNDIQYNNDINYTAQKYNSSFQLLSSIYPEVNFYIMSINPVNDKSINKNFKTNVRTNNNIKKLNEKIVNFIDDINYSNLKYCDSYNDINFNTKDGLHYTKGTNEKIIKYILDDCVNNV